jgi:hypothetical protein
MIPRRARADFTPPSSLSDEDRVVSDLTSRHSEESSKGRNTPFGRSGDGRLDVKRTQPRIVGEEKEERCEKFNLRIGYDVFAGKQGLVINFYFMLY